MWRSLGVRWRLMQAATWRNRVCRLGCLRCGQIHQRQRDIWDFMHWQEIIPTEVVHFRSREHIRYRGTWLEGPRLLESL